MKFQYRLAEGFIDFEKVEHRNFRGKLVLCLCRPPNTTNKKHKTTTIFDHFRTKHSCSNTQNTKVPVRICSTKHRHTNAFVFCTSTNVITLVFCVFCVCTDESLDGHFAYICSFSPHGGLPNKTHLNTSSKP